MELIGLLLLTTLLLVLISIYRWATGSLDYWQKRGIPYVPALPAVGNFFSVLSGKYSCILLSEFLVMQSVIG
jgi:hypothetical protein